MSVTLSCFYCTPLSDDAMDDAQKALDAAVARRTQIAELLVVTRAAVDEDRRNTIVIYEEGTEEQDRSFERCRRST